MYSRRLLPGYALGLAALSLCGNAYANGLYPTQFFSAINAPGAVVAADVDGDGKLDLVEIGADQTVAVLKGNGDGTFKSPGAYYAAGNGLEALAVADLDGDGKLDIVVVNNADNTVSVLLGKGDGTFKGQTAVELANGKGTAAPTYAVGKGPDSVTIADVNNDGIPDLIVANFVDGTVSILLGKGNGTFKLQTTVDVAVGPTYVTAADMNHDGNIDLIVSSSTANMFGVLRGRGDGTFGAETTTKLGAPFPQNSLQTLVVGDFNHDGNLDVITTTSDLNAETADYFPGDGKGGFGPGRFLLTGRETAYLATADLNGDGNLDLIAGSFASSTLRVMFGNGLGGFSSGVDYPAVGITGALNAQAFVVGDFTGHGHPDIASVNTAASLIQVLNNDGQGHFHLSDSYPTGVAPSDVQTADLNGDGHLDLVDINSADGTMDVRLGNGDGTFQAAQTYPVGSSPQRLFLVDLRHNGKLDAVTVNFGNGEGTVSVLLGNGDGTFQSARHFDAGPNAVDLAVGDMDQDGKLDLVVANAVVNTVSILRGNGDGTFKPRQAYPADDVINGLTVGDIDHSGFPAVITVGNFVSVLRNDGKGGLVQPTFLKNGLSVDIYRASGVRVALSDVNHDNQPDILVADYSDSLLVVLLGNSKGYFTPVPTNYPTCANPRSLALADLNADGNVDVAVTCVGGSAVGVMLGNGTGGFLNFAYPAELDPRGLAIGDFNEDGQPDIAVANGGSDNIHLLLETHGVVANDLAPKAVDSAFVVDDGAQSQSGSLEALDKDGDPLSFVIVQQPPLVNGIQPGLVVGSSDGVFVYFASTGVTGSTTFKFQATDGVKLSNIAQINVNVLKNSSGGKSSSHHFLGGFWLPLLPVLGLFAALRRRRRS